MSVHVNYDDYEELHWIPSFFDSLSCAQLTSLTLVGYFVISGYHFLPNSIQLPLLEKFVCKVIEARALVEAIVAPSLSHMECYSGISDNSPNNNFTGLESKFTCVDRVVLFDSHPVFQGLDSRGAKDICLAFPNIRHLTLSSSEAAMMLHPDAAAHWQHLKSLTIHSTAKDSSDFLGGLLPWLKRRLDMSRPMITVTFQGWMNGHAISSSYEALHGICFLEWSGVRYHPEVVISGAVSSRPWLEMLEMSKPFRNFASGSKNTMSVWPFLPGGIYI
ncbi:hypothetical protein EDC04DRAFT_861655 [Pisolithus marmoratus]|nr:hypothetical protein EDC04DRAFT_861655 [Pisolithus marmoratus]